MSQFQEGIPAGFKKEYPRNERLFCRKGESNYAVAQCVK
jgi:hypothetical protein